MYQVEAIKSKLLRMFNQAAISYSTRERLVAYLTAVADMAVNTKGGAIAESLLTNLERYAKPRCSEAQAKAIAYTAFEYFIIL